MTTLIQDSLVAMSGRVEATKILSVVTIVIGAVCTAFGIPTVILMGSPAFPFSSGSGIYCGILAVLCGVLGLLFVREVGSSNPSQVLCYSGAHRGFQHVALSIAGLHFGFGISALINCSQGDTAEGCGGVSWSANFLLAEVNMSMGLIIWFLCLLTILISWKVHSLACKKFNQIYVTTFSPGSINCVS